MHYYNEFDKKTAAWLRELIARGHLPKGHVDDRSIVDVQPGDLAGYVQCHFFAGIGGWPYALQLAGWPANEPIWTASLPCQPFSVAGKQRGFDDDRHLWPHFGELAWARKPPVILGEQVASAIGKGWLDVVSDDFEAHDYELGATVFKACSCGSPTERERLYWIASSAKRERGARLVTRANPCQPGQRLWRGKEDLRRVYARPLERGDVWPKPIIRRVDDGIPGRVARLHGYGNAIDIRAATMFIRAVTDSL
jgi:DNA (cytosine-5)-methyltransferase 1